MHLSVHMVNTGILGMRRGVVCLASSNWVAYSPDVIKVKGVKEVSIRSIRL